MLVPDGECKGIWVCKKKLEPPTVMDDWISTSKDFDNALYQKGKFLENWILLDSKMIGNYGNFEIMMTKVMSKIITNPLLGFVGIACFFNLTETEVSPVDLAYISRFFERDDLVYELDGVEEDIFYIGFQSELSRLGLFINGKLITESSELNLANQDLLYFHEKMILIFLSCCRRKLSLPQTINAFSFWMRSDNSMAMRDLYGEERLGKFLSDVSVALTLNEVNPDILNTYIMAMPTWIVHWSPASKE